MPIFASNFAANALQGTVTVAGGLANIVLPLSAFAFEGTKTFVVKLRKEGFTGTVIGTSNTITIPDTTTIVSLTANATTAAEGNVILYTLTTSNVVNGTNVYYTTNSIITANVNSNDFVGGNTGVITIANNVGTLRLTTNADVSLFDETTEAFTLQIRTNNTNGNVVITSSNVTVLDTSNQYNVLSFVESASSATEGGTLTLTANVINISAGTLLYYDTTGNVTTSNFTGGNTGSFRMNSVSNTISLVTTSAVPYGTSVDFRVRIRRDSVTGTVLATSNNLLINDSSLTQMAATGGNITVLNGYKYHTFNTSSNLSVTGIGTTGGAIEYLVVAGGGGGGPTNNAGKGSGAGAGGYKLNVSGELSGGPSSTAQPANYVAAGQNYTITVGAGGTAPSSPSPGVQGNPSSITGTGPSWTNVSTTGGGAGGYSGSVGYPGGSGGGGQPGANGTGIATEGYPGNSAQGPNGSNAAAGGGAGGAATNESPQPYGSFSASGGVGRNPTAFGTWGPSGYFAGGGGGGSNGGHPTPGPFVGYAGGGGAGGGGGGGSGSGGTPGTINTGGGGGGAGIPATTPVPSVYNAGGTGGSGIVIIRYPFTGQYFTTLTTSSTNVLTGGNVIFNLSVLNANGTTLYYSTSGNANSSHFIGGNTGSFTANTTGATITLQTNSSAILDVSKIFGLEIRQDSTTGPISITSSSNVVLYNVSDFYINATGGNITIVNGYKYHSFTTSGNLLVNSVATVTPANNSMDYLVIGAGGGGAAGNGTFYSGGGGGGGNGNTGSITATVNNFGMLVGGGGAGGTGYPAGDSANGTSSSILSGGTIGFAQTGFRGQYCVSHNNGDINIRGYGGASGNTLSAFGLSDLGNGAGSSGGGMGTSGFAYNDATYPGQGGRGKYFANFDRYGTNVTNSVSNVSGKGYFGGGAGSTGWPTVYSGKLGGYGGGANGQNDNVGLSGLQNTGGGGSGGSGGGGNYAGGSGASGIIIIRYPYV